MGYGDFPNSSAPQDRCHLSTSQTSRPAELQGTAKNLHNRSVIMIAFASKKLTRTRSHLGPRASFAALTLVTLSAQSLLPFEPLGAQTAGAAIEPDFFLNGPGRDIDTIAFWETDSPRDALMFVSSKASSLIEVWPFPFSSANQADPIRHGTFGASRVNGVVVDQANDRLYVSVGGSAASVSEFSLPSAQFGGTLLSGVRLGQEPGLALYQDEARSWLYVTAGSRPIRVLDTRTRQTVLTHAVERELETLLADEYHRVVYVPDEGGRTGIYAFTPELAPYSRDGRTSFGRGVFQDDAEGILLYRCESSGRDTGRGFIVVSDQREPLTDFEFFDRVSWDHLGTLRLSGVGNTDGIASTQRALPAYPLGLFAAVDDDTRTAGIGWDKILSSLGLSCDSA